MTDKSLKTAIEITQAAAALLGNKSQSEVAGDLSRDVKIVDDFKLHQFITSQLTKLTGLPVLSEEDPVEVTTQGSYWLVDPIDGSVNYSRGIPLSCISIALWQGLNPIAGVVMDFHRNELFSGSVDSGAKCNQEPIRVSQITTREQAICLTGFPVATSFETTALETFIKQVQQFKKVRLLGTAALSLAYVAAGRADFYMEKSIALWDVAAGLALVKAAGGKFSLVPTSNTLRFDVIATNQTLEF